MRKGELWQGTSFVGHVQQQHQRASDPPCTTPRLLPVLSPHQAAGALPRRPAQVH